MEAKWDSQSALTFCRSVRPLAPQNLSVEGTLMSTELKGKIKEKLWVRSICTDDSESLARGREARKDFKTHCRGDDGPFEVASIDILDEANELGDPPIMDGQD